LRETPSVSQLDVEESVYQTFTLEGQDLIKDMEAKVPLLKSFQRTGTVALPISMPRLWDMFFKDNAKHNFKDFYTNFYEDSKNLDLTKWTTAEFVETQKDF
jgi:hypothetical protein